MVKILETFESIQGEGTYMGRKAVFIRLAGCNLNCSFCDTQDIMKQPYTACDEDALVDHCIEIYPFLKGIQSIVIITGGEPTLQLDACAQISNLFKEENSNIKIHIETNGTRKYRVNKYDWKNIFNWTVCSPKRDSDWQIEEYADELKYVVDKDFDIKVISQEVRDQYAGKIWLQPDGNTMFQSWQKAMELVNLDPRLRIGVQLHKVMGVQ